MKSAWKGLVVGGFTGGVLGLVMDALARTGKAAVAVKDAAGEKAPEAIHWAKEFGGRATDRLKDVDVGEKMHEKMHALAGKVAEADLGGKAHDLAKKAADSAVADKVVDFAKKAADTGSGKAHDLVKMVSDTDVAGKAHDLVKKVSDTDVAGKAHDLAKSLADSKAADAAKDAMAAASKSVKEAAGAAKTTSNGKG